MADRVRPHSLAAAYGVNPPSVTNLRALFISEDTLAAIVKTQLDKALQRVILHEQDSEAIPAFFAFQDRTKYQFHLFPLSYQCRQLVGVHYFSIIEKGQHFGNFSKWRRV